MSLHQQNQISFSFHSLQNTAMTTPHETTPLLAGRASTGASSSSSTTTTATAALNAPPTTGQSPKSPTSHNQETRGLIYMTLSAFFFSIVSLLISITARTLPSFELLFFRGVIQALLGIAACRYLNISPWGHPNVRFLLFMRGLVGTCALALFFFSLSVLPLADATVMFFLGPVFTAILGRIVLKEPFGPLDALASILPIIGVVLVVKPSALFPSPPDDNPSLIQFNSKEGEDQRRLLGALCAVVGAMCSAVVRHHRKSVFGYQSLSTCLPHPPQLLALLIWNRHL